MPAHRLYFTPEEKAAARQRTLAKYDASDKGRAKAAEWLAANPEKVAARYARYRQSEKYRATQERYRASAKSKDTDSRYQAWAKANAPERVRARAAIAIALRQGSLIRPGECQACSRPGVPDAHHHLGYATEHWLDILWLCRVCHKAAHS